MVTELATQELARARAARIRAGIATYLHTLADISAAYAQRDWTALGYADWQAYVDGEYGAERLRLSPEHRAKAVTELRLAGMSQRAIGSALGISHTEVGRQLQSGGTNVPPEIRGADGKTYAATRPTDSGKGESRVGAASLTSADHPREGEADARLAAARTAASEAPTGAATPVGVGDEPEWPEIRKPAASSPDPHAEDDARRDAELDAELSATTTRFRVNFSSARLRAAEITNFDPDRVCEVYAANFDREVGDLLNRLGQWAEQVKEAHRSRQRAGLRLVSGGDR